MCKGIKELEEMRREEGEQRLNKLMNILAARGYQLTEILAATSDAEKRARWYEKYGIA